MIDVKGEVASLADTEGGKVESLHETERRVAHIWVNSSNRRHLHLQIESAGRH